MGAEKSTLKVYTEYLNSTALKSLLKVGVATSSYVSSEQKLVIAQSKGINIKDVDFMTEISINMKSMLDASKTGKLQAQLMSDIENKINVEKSKFPVIGKYESDSTIRNIVKNSVDLYFSSEAITELSSNIESNQQLAVMMSEELNIENIKFKSEINFVGEQINKTSEQIVNDLNSDITAKMEAELKEKSVVEDIGTAVSGIVDSIFGGLSELFGLSPWTLFFILLIMIVVIIGVWIRYRGGTTKEEKNGGYFESIFI